MLAPARATSAAFAGPIPPSTSIQRSRRPRASAISRICRILRSAEGMKAWPPKPGLTLITRTMSTSSRTYSTEEGWVAGLSATAGRAPSLRICCSVRCRCVQASTWTVTMSAPASTKAGMSFSGSTIIRCTSSGFFATCATASTTMGPMVRLGTKRPSITSTWTRSQPPASMAATSSASRPKSAERIEGATSSSRAKGELLSRTVYQSPGVATSSGVGAQRAYHHREKFVQVVGFAQRVPADLRPVFHLGDVPADEDGDTGGEPLLQMGAQGAAVHVGEPRIQQDDLGVKRPDRLQRIARRARHPHRSPFVFQHRPRHAAEIVVVLHHEYLHTRQCLSHVYPLAR